MSNRSVYADLRGVGTHGVARIPAYVERFRQRLVNPQSRIRVEQRLPWAAVVDGDNGMGAMVAAHAMQEVLSRAETFGIGAATVRHGNHFGAAAHYALMAVERGCIGISLSPASRSLAPFGSREPLLGTNPLAARRAGRPLPALGHGHGEQHRGARAHPSGGAPRGADPGGVGARF